MPTAPAEVIPEWSAPSPDAPASVQGAQTRNPSAPGEITAEWSAPSPDAPAAVQGAQTRNPSAPGEIIPEWSAPTAAETAVTVGGTLSPDATGTLVRSSGAAYPTIYPDAPLWSTDGSATVPGPVDWTRIYQYGVKLPAGGTVDELAPKNLYTPSESSTPSQKVSFLSTLDGTGTWAYYWLYSNNGNPRWVLLGDATLADAGSTEIAAGVYALSSNIPTPPFPGGPLAEYTEDPDAEWGWLIQHYLSDSGGVVSGTWWADGPAGTPPADGWSARSPATGTPEITVDEGDGLQPPAQIIP